MSTHLVIPDAHAKPGIKNDRFTWLGKLIVDIKPDVVICLGDFADMHSLSSYDRGKASFFGASYKADVESALDAQEKLFRPIKKTKKKLPRFVMLGGNHEDRIHRVLDYDNHLTGAIGYNDLEYGRYWDFYPFLEKVAIDGVTYSHYIQAGNSGRAIAGKYHANALLMQELVSTTVGHSHMKDYREMATGHGKRIHGLAAGCYFDHYESYAGPGQDKWWRGITVKRNVHKGDYDPQFISLDNIKKEYK